MNTTIMRPSLLLTGTVTLLVALTGCMSAASQPVADGTPASPTTCAQPPTVGPDTPTVAILGETGPELEYYQQDIDMVVETSKTLQARVIVNGITGEATAPNLLANVVLIGEGNNELFRDKDLECRTEVVTAAIRSLEDYETPEHYNVFGALRKLAGNLENNPSDQPVDVVLLTRLAAVGGSVDLTDPEALANPAKMINTLAREQLMPTSCEGWRIYGVGADRGLHDIQAAALREFWRQYAQKCGGKIVSWTDHLVTFPATEEIAPGDTSQIEIDEEPEKATATFGSDVLFPPDSAVLQDSAQAALHELLALTQRYEGEILITGHTNPVGTPNSTAAETLSKQRAEAVKNWLVDNGVATARIATDGKGATEPIYDNPQTESEKAANRRVVAVVYSATG